MSPLALFYGAAFGGAIVSSLLMGLVWIAGRLFRFTVEQKRALYRTAAISGPVLVVTALLAMTGWRIS